MDEVEEIKRKIDIVDLISQYLTLKKAGANYKALCPFHQEKTPSFMVSPEKQIFKCFGCSESGDIFGFVMKMEGLEFVEALKMLADRAGVILQKTKSKEQYQKEKDIKSQLYKINQLASQVYHKILLEYKGAQKARDYLKKRGLQQKTNKDFLLGYAPSKPILANFLKKRGFSAAEVKQAGSPERFRNRIIFPIMDVMGNVTGFTGRALDVKLQPKYLNTPESPIFHKSRILYGLDKAKNEIKLNKESIMVEGQMDVVLSYQVGITNVVASSGTALTADHLQILARYSPNIIFAFDQDFAGREAAKKALLMAIENEMNVKMTLLPEGIKDPGEAINKDPQIWQQAVKKSLPVLDWYFQLAFDKFEKEKKELTGQEKKEIAKELLPIIKIIPDRIEQSHYLQLLAKKLSVPERTIIEALNRVKTKSEKKKQSTPSRPKITTEENLIGLLLLYPKFLQLIVTDLDYSDFSADSLAQKIYKALQSCYTRDSCNEKVCLGKDCKGFLNKKFDSDLLKKINFLILEIENSHQDSEEEEIKKEILDCAARIKSQKKEKSKEDFAQKIKEAEGKGDRQMVKKLLEEFQRIIK